MFRTLFAKLCGDTRVSPDAPPPNDPPPDNPPPVPITHLMNSLTIEDAPVSESLRGRIVALEKEAYVSRKSRPRGYSDEEYITYLEDMIDEENEQGDGELSLYHFEKALVNCEGRKFNDSGFILFHIHQGVSFSGDQRKPFLFRDFFSKTDIRGNGAEEEYKRYSAFLNRLKKKEREELLQFVGVVHKDGKFKSSFMLKFSNDLHMGNPGLSLDKKNTIAKKLLSSYSIFLRHQCIIPDIKQNNVLFMNDTYWAVLCDFEGLIDFKTLMKNPTPQAHQNLLRDIRVWNPLHLPIEEYVEVYNGILHKIIPLDKIYNDLVSINIFGLGSLLYWMYTSEFPYSPLEAPHIGNINGRYRTQYVTGALPDADRLSASSCPEPMRELILKMVDPDKTKRPLTF